MRYVSDKTYSEQITIGIFNKVLNQLNIFWRKFEDFLMYNVLFVCEIFVIFCL